MFSDYIVYVDESGDHGLSHVDANYPVFVLVFCIFRKVDYADHVLSALQKLKFRYFGHDQIILHERDIRKRQGPFSILKDTALRQRFLVDTGEVIQNLPMTLIVSVIDKRILADRYECPNNPYALSMRFALERLDWFLRQKGERERMTHVIVERRGKVEDAQLEQTFREICSGDNWHGRRFPFEPVFVDKKSNSSGLQVADLIARPAGMAYLRPDQQNTAWDIAKTKLYRGASGSEIGSGWKVFP